MCFTRSFCTILHTTCIDVHLKELGKRGHLRDAIQCLQQSNFSDFHISLGTYVCLLHNCIRFKAYQEGKYIHVNICRNGLMLDVSLANALITMYIKCGDMMEAALVFEGMLKRNVFTWTLIIGGYTKFGHANEAFLLFWRMVSEGNEKPDRFAFLAILKACTTLEQGRQVHLCIVRFNLQSDNFLISALIDMYSRCGSVDMACELFDKGMDYDVVTWNSMISSYAQLGHSMPALALFAQLQQLGMEPNNITYLSIIKACTVSEALRQGKFIHCYIKESNVKPSIAIDNALIDMYAKCGSLGNAEIVFSKIRKPNVISWTAMVVASTQYGCFKQALQYFWQMQKEEVRPDDVAYVSAMKACANLATFDSGKQVHICMVINGVKLWTFLENALIDMYVKCGSMDVAYQIFKNMGERDLISWSTMVSGFALHGSPVKSFELTKGMQEVEVEPDKVTFFGVLSACRHAGWVDEGLRSFKSMTQEYGLIPTMEHYACLVDMLTRAGCLEQAFTFLCQFNFPWCEQIWTSVLAASGMFGEFVMARHAIEHLLELEPQKTGAFVLLSNIYAKTG